MKTFDETYDRLEKKPGALRFFVAEKIMGWRIVEVFWGDQKGKLHFTIHSMGSGGEEAFKPDQDLQQLRDTVEANAKEDGEVWVQYSEAICLAKGVSVLKENSKAPYSDLVYMSASEKLRCLVKAFYSEGRFMLEDMEEYL